MGDYADDAFDRDFHRWMDDGCPATPVIKRIEGDPCGVIGCKGKLVKRVNSKTGENFLGCSEWYMHKDLKKKIQDKLRSEREERERKNHEWFEERAKK